MSKKPIIVFEGIEGSGKSHHIKIVSRYFDKNKIKYLTLFALSSENFDRPSVKILYDIIYTKFSILIDDLIKSKKVKLEGRFLKA